ncbi:hypothetical protein [Mangrovimonas sp. TPBH4]|uniref:hypothetical protein n=1 Tax=Mangrovimonas sp. TPBH4 TaxID=1645914 RepID=UPI0006B5C13B|nr:hypothetical protein [Mangrovimonas sp. TPBH4]
MGYMGFGIQKWIYSMRPRAPFSKERKPSFTKLDTYSRQFKLQPSKSSGNFYIRMSFLMLIFGGVVVYYMVPEVLNHRNKVDKLYAKRIYEEEQEAFTFLVHSGMERLKRHHYLEAYNEFELAFKINPKDEALNDAMLQTLSVLCRDNKKYCELLECKLVEN